MRYDDIIGLPHHVSEKHPQMSLCDRAAQFAPFAALTGFDDMVTESARITAEKIELDDYEKMRLDGELQKIEERLDELPEAEITHFVADEKKSGGKYVVKKGRIVKIDEYNREIVFGDGYRIKTDTIVEISFPAEKGLTYEQI